MFDWGKNKIKENAIRILKPGTQKYLLVTKSELRLNTMHTTSTNECKWVVNVKEIKEASYIIELFTLENLITETNNPMVHELAAYKNLFREVYDELVLEIDFFGQLVAVKNIALLQQKWQRVREGLSTMLKGNPQVASVITVNDTLFSNHENVKAIIGAMEFFELFFAGFYGKELPTNVNVVRNNRLKATPLKWVFTFSYPDAYHYYDTSKPLQINLKGQIFEPLTMQKIEQVYGKFEFISAKKINAQFSSEGKFFIDRRTGMINEAEYYHKEIIDNDLLFTINHYNLKTYE